MHGDYFSEENGQIISRGTRRRRMKRDIRKYWVAWRRAQKASDISETAFAEDYKENHPYWTDHRGARTFVSGGITIDSDTRYTTYWVSVHINPTARRGTLRFGRRTDWSKHRMGILRMSRCMCVVLLRCLQRTDDGDVLDNFMNHMLAAGDLKTRLKIWLAVHCKPAA